MMDDGWKDLGMVSDVEIERSEGTMVIPTTQQISGTLSFKLAPIDHKTILECITEIVAFWNSHSPERRAALKRMHSEYHRRKR